jgi:type I restriction enzyme S subunit
MTSKRLRSIADVTAGTSPKGDQINAEGLGIPFFQGSKEFGDLYPVALRHTESPIRKAKEGDILVSVRAPVGEVNFAATDCAIGRGVMAVSPKSDSDRNFIFYLLKNLHGNWDSMTSAGSVFENLSASTLRDLEIPMELPRAAIGDLLFTFDSKIQANVERSRTLHKLARSVFKAWFVDFQPVSANLTGEPMGGLSEELGGMFPNAFSDTPIGSVPTGWRVTSLFDCELEIESGSRPKGGVSAIKTGKPSIGAESINGIGVFDYSKTKYVPDAFFDKMKRGKPHEFDVLLYKDGGKPGEFKPRVGMFGLGFPFPEFAINEHVFSLRSRTLGQPFLYFFIEWKKTLDELRLRGIKAAIPGINQQDVGTLMLAVPDQSVLDAFNEFVQPMLELILSLSIESQLLAKSRDALMARLYSGALELPDEFIGA